MPAATIQVTNIEFVTVNLPMWKISAGFSGTASCFSSETGVSSGSIAMTDPASMQPQTSARIDAENLERKRCGIGCKFCKAAARRSQQRAGGEAEAHDQQGRLRRAYQSAFYRDDKEENTKHIARRNCLLTSNLKPFDSAPLRSGQAHQTCFDNLISSSTPDRSTSSFSKVSLSV
jgi:hypothetical protein